MFYENGSEIKQGNFPAGMQAKGINVDIYCINYQKTYQVWIVYVMLGFFEDFIREYLNIQIRMLYAKLGHLAQNCLFWK